MPPLLTLDGVDATCDVIADVQVTRGRNHPAENFDPSTCQLSFVNPTASSIHRGQIVDLALDAPSSNPTWADATGTWAAATGSWASQEVRLTLFHGYITDLAADWAVDANGTTLPTVKALAVDPLGRLANQLVGDVPWPSETCAARAARIAALVGITLSVLGTGPALIARDVDRQPALDLLDACAADGSEWGGIYYDPATATYVWTLGDERNTTTPAITLTDCDVDAGATVTQVVSDIVNDVTVTYGSPSAEVHSTDASQTVNGYRHTSISTDLANTVDAQARADAHVLRYGAPQWKVDNLEVHSAVLDPATQRPLAEALLKLPLGARVRINTLPPPGDVYGDGYLEGWAFTMLGNPASWTVGLRISPVAWSGPVITWSGAGVIASTWDTVPPDTTWQMVVGG